MTEFVWLCSICRWWIVQIQNNFTMHYTTIK